MKDVKIVSIVEGGGGYRMSPLKQRSLISLYLFLGSSHRVHSHTEMPSILTWLSLQTDHEYLYESGMPGRMSPSVRDMHKFFPFILTHLLRF